MSVSFLLFSRFVTTVTFSFSTSTFVTCLWCRLIQVIIKARQKKYCLHLLYILLMSPYLQTKTSIWSSTGLFCDVSCFIQENSSSCVRFCSLACILRVSFWFVLLWVLPFSLHGFRFLDHSCFQQISLFAAEPDWRRVCRWVLGVQLLILTFADEVMDWLLWSAVSWF